MLTVTLKSNGYTIEGHAGFAESGQDIVCSAVSVLAQVIRDMLIQKGRTFHVGRSGFMEVLVEHPNQQTRLLLETFTHGVTEIERAFPDHVKIIR